MTRRSGECQVVLELDTVGIRLHLEHRATGSDTWLRAAIRDFDGEWDLPIDYGPRKLVVLPGGIELRNSLGRVLDTLPHPAQAAYRWTTRPSGT